jgi:hypothetical protein
MKMKKHLLDQSDPDVNAVVLKLKRRKREMRKV